MTVLSPICEFGILAARARSKENAAIAKSSLPPRGGKTGHSCKAQQDKSVELTDCGQRVLSLRLRQWLLSAATARNSFFIAINLHSMWGGAAINIFLIICPLVQYLRMI
jgi:hypothetical protein